MAFQTTDSGVLHLQKVEGLRLRAYDDKNPNDYITSLSQVEGTLTIGYGHTKTVKAGDEITKERAIALMKIDLSYFQDQVNRMVTAPITQNMFNALVSFCYNVGENGFKKSSPLRLTNEGKYLEAAESFKLWNIPASILGRREQEKELYLTGSGVLSYSTTKKKTVLTLSVIIAMFLASVI